MMRKAAKEKIHRLNLKEPVDIIRKLIKGKYFSCFIIIIYLLP